MTGDPCPHAEAAYRTALSLPLYPDLTEEETDLLLRLTRGALQIVLSASPRFRHVAPPEAPV
jgi:hypothetical protein